VYIFQGESFFLIGIILSPYISIRAYCWFQSTS